MCGICGCGEVDLEHHHQNHDHEHNHEHDHNLIQIEKNLLDKNNQIAAQNSEYFSAQEILAIHLVSSPGSGKTTLLEKTLSELKNQFSIAVIEGDQQTDRDLQRIKALGIPAVQINTGKICHLDAHMIHHAIDDLSLQKQSLLFIENVGNLVCPALFNLGESYRAVMLSVTEGDDKPLKYPDMFQTANLMIINKVDLLPYVTFDVEKCIEYARRINPTIEILQISATKNEGLKTWYHWLTQQHAKILLASAYTS
jgi:hydrogenase nickel incorporation protein HypB